MMVHGRRQPTTCYRDMTRATLENWLPNANLRGQPSKTPTRVPCGKLWPHDEFSLGYASLRPDGGPWHEDVYTGMGVHDTDEARRDAQAKLGTLNLSVASNSHSRAKRGLNGMTGHGRNMVKSVGALMSRQYRGWRVTFCTLTVPTLPKESRRALVEKWPELVRQLVQWLSRRLATQGVPRVIASVTEIQPKRLTNSGEGYLHLHVVWLNVPARARNWSVDVQELRAWFERAMVRFADWTGEGHVNVNVKPVKGEVTRYMAKYMTKGAAQLREAQEDWGEDVTPSTWYNLSKPARDWVKANLWAGPVAGRLIETMLDYAWETGETGHIPYIRPIELTIDECTYTVGYRGRFDTDCADNMRTLLKCA